MNRRDGHEIVDHGGGVRKRFPRVNEGGESGIWVLKKMSLGGMRKKRDSRHLLTILRNSGSKFAPSARLTTWKSASISSSALRRNYISYVSLSGSTSNGRERTNRARCAAAAQMELGKVYRTGCQWMRTVGGCISKRIGGSVCTLDILNKMCNELSDGSLDCIQYPRLS